MFSYVHRDPNKNGQVNGLTTILLPSEIVTVKIEAHTKSTEPEDQGKPLVDFQAKATITESIRLWYMWINSILFLHKMIPLCQTFAILMSLQHSNCLLLNQRRYSGQTMVVN